MSGNLKYVVGKREGGREREEHCLLEHQYKDYFRKIKCLYFNVFKSFSDSNNCPTTIIMAVLGMRDE